jgi:hypothetical protein
MLDIKLNAHTRNGVVILSQYIDGGGFEIHCHADGTNHLFYIPQYGGEPQNEGVYSTIHEAINIAMEWK